MIFKNFSHKKRMLLSFSIILFIAFVVFSYLVAKERFTQHDFDTTVKLQDNLSRRWDLKFSLLSVLGSAEVTMLIWAGLVVLALLKRYWLTVLSLGLLPLALAMEIFGKTFLYHPGPPYLFYRGVIRFDFFPSHYIHNEYSYPSGHMLRTTFLITFIATFIFLKTPFKIQLFTLPFLLALFIAMAISRVYLGEHWTTDVIGGSLIGISFGILAGLTIPAKKAKVFHKEE